MKKDGWSLILFLLCYVVMHGQKIQYSRQTIKTPLADAMQLVTNVAGNHHLLYFTAGKRPKLYVFNKQLQLVDEKEIEEKLIENCNVQIIPFQDFYYLYLHVPGTANRSIIRIDKEGEATDLSRSMMKLMDSAGIKTTATFELINHRNRLYLCSHAYFEAVKQVNTTVLEFNSNLELLKLNTASFPFDRKKENLQQTMLANDHLLVLKTIRDEEKGNILEVAKFNLTSGDVLLNSFVSGSHLYSNPGFRYCAKDSSLVLYSLLREPVGAGRQQRTVFVSKLNDSLQQITPISLLKTQFRNNAGYNFLFLGGVQPFWLTFSNNVRIGMFFYRRNDASYFGFGDARNINRLGYRGRYSANMIEYSQPTAVRLTMLDEKLATTTDSLVANQGSFYDLQPQPSAQFTINDAAYLVLIQNFSYKKRGLVMLHSNGQGKLITTPLPVYDRYEYHVSLLQSSNNYFIMPYTHKSETGLLKITVND